METGQPGSTQGGQNPRTKEDGVSRPTDGSEVTREAGLDNLIVKKEDFLRL